MPYTATSDATPIPARSPASSAVSAGWNRSAIAARTETPTVLGRAAWTTCSQAGATFEPAGSSATLSGAFRKRAKGSFVTRKALANAPAASAMSVAAEGAPSARAATSHTALRASLSGAMSASLRRTDSTNIVQA